ncbi:MAG: hypothetical protein DLM58_10120 [Pseudonocardiales bacterium]|nr:MAG: hypothetical protein DLM58_10120 [Pseudonocardiales bacterium]
MYDATDPRATLAASAMPTGARPREPQFFEFGSTPPVMTSPMGSETWLVRTQNLIVAYTHAHPGEVLSRRHDHDEYLMLLSAQDAQVTISGTGWERHLDGEQLAIVPPGDSDITVRGVATAVVRVFSSRNAGLARRCVNHDRYETPDNNVAEFHVWPGPRAGGVVHDYALATVPPAANRLGRIYRASIAMVNVFYPEAGPRDPAKMSPHHHDDFEQLSLQLAGDYVHHVRTPWGVDLGGWRADVHQFCTSPSVAIFPPPLVHTSQAIGAGLHRLVDVFGPPRLDFSDQPGWVLNSDDYPRP